MEAEFKKALREFKAAMRSPDRKHIVRDMLEQVQTNHANDALTDPTSSYFEKSRRALLGEYPRDQRGSRAPLIGGLIAAFRLRAGRARSNMAALQTDLVSHVSASFSGSIAAVLAVTLGVFSAPGLAPAMQGHAFAVSSIAVVSPDTDADVEKANSAGSPVRASAEVGASGVRGEAAIAISRKRDLRVERTVVVHAVGEERRVATGTVFWSSCDSRVREAACDTYDGAVAVHEQSN